MTRTRSEYRLHELTVGVGDGGVGIEPVRDGDRDELATVMLDAYRGTIDDEGEDLDDAREAIDHYLSIVKRPLSGIVRQNGAVVAFAFVVVVDGLHYIDPVVVRSDAKRRGLGAAAVRNCLARLAAHGVTEVGATITDGNIASEALFAGLGFVRVGAW